MIEAIEIIKWRLFETRRTGIRLGFWGLFLILIVSFAYGLKYIFPVADNLTYLKSIFALVVLEMLVLFLRKKKYQKMLRDGVCKDYEEVVFVAFLDVLFVFGVLFLWFLFQDSMRFLWGILTAFVGAVISVVIDYMEIKEWLKKGIIVRGKPLGWKVILR